MLPDVQTDPLVFQFVSLVLSLREPEDPGSIWFTSSLQIRKYIYELPPVGQTDSDLLNGTKADRLMNFLFKKPSHYMLQSTVKVDER